MAENKYIDMIQGLAELAAELARSLLYIKSKLIHNRRTTHKQAEPKHREREHAAAGTDTISPK